MINLFWQSNYHKLKWIILLDRLGLDTLGYYRKTCFQFGLISRLYRSCKASRYMDSSLFCQLNDSNRVEFKFSESCFALQSDKYKFYIFKHLVSINPKKSLEMVRGSNFNHPLVEITKITLNPKDYPEDIALSVLNIVCDSRYYLNRYNYFLSCGYQETLSCLNDFLVQ